MRELIEEFKKKNGNEKITQKELLFYLVAKIDKFDEKLDSVKELGTKNSTAIFYLKFIIGIVLAAIVALAL